MNYTIDDVSYAYEVQGEGPVVVLLHGFTSSSSTWSKFVSKWKSKMRIITIDIPGHGKTIAKTPRPMELLCNDLMKLFHHLNLASVHLLGYSMGGRVALSFAMLYPEYVTSLILESASPGLQIKEERVKRIESDEKLADKIESDGIVSFVDFWEDVPLFFTQKNMSEKTQTKIRKERLNQTEEGLAQSLRSIGTGNQPSWWECLTSFSKPVQLIVGGCDTKFVKINEQMKERFRFCNLIRIENAGHAVHVEQPSTFGEIVSEFIFQIERGGYS